MHLKMFRTVKVRVPDPFRPGKRTFEDRLLPTEATHINHGGQEFTADEDGWFDVPHDVGQWLLSFRAQNGEQFYTPDQVDEQVRLGMVAPDGPPARARRAPAASR